MKRVLALAVLVVVGAACGDSSSSGGDGDGVRVVSAFYPLAYAAERVGGDAVDVVNVTPVGAEAHDLELTPDQVDDIEDADVVLYVGGGFQPALEDVAERHDGAVDVLESVEGDHGDDVHFWLDPTEYVRVVERIADAIGAAVPTAEREAIADNARAFVADLERLDDEVEAGLATCERRAFVTSHAAFGFLAARYELEQLSVSGLSPESEPDAARLDELTDEIRERGIDTVFYEELVAPDVAETLAREAGVRAEVLSPLEGLTEEQAESGEDYLSVMRDNLGALREALGCS